ncbi:MAG: hypothetical protein HYX20_01995 [Candidatus Yanofskybacteria bacterium]|nr:hypothetical protein [Candidatus Yanofskybacteria bacterium]
MADEIKPPVSGSTISPSSQIPPITTPPKPIGTPPPSRAMEGIASPLTPDIKIPPNLPIREEKPSATPPSAGGILPKPSVSPSGQPSTIFKSSIRTMQDDLSSLNKGQTPAGFKIEKESEKEAKMTPQAVSPKITPPPPISHVELGKLERAKPLTAEITPLRQAGLGTGQVQKPAAPIPPQLGLSKPSISIPSASGIFDRFKSDPKFKRIAIYVIVGIVGFIITAYVISYFTFLPNASVSPTPSAILTRTPTVAPISIESLFSVSDSVGITFGPDFTTRFIDSVKKDPLFSLREPGIYKIASVDGANRYGFAEFFSGVSVVVPDELKQLIDDGNFWLTLTYKSDNTLSFGFIVKLLSSNKVNEVIVAAQNWEGAMTQTIANLFQFDSAKTASIGFLDNTYNGVAVRYRNFPDPNSTIDYAVIQAKNGESYLIVVNSREHIYKMVDKIK